MSTLQLLSFPKPFQLFESFFIQTDKDEFREQTKSTFPFQLSSTTQAMAVSLVAWLGPSVSTTTSNASLYSDESHSDINDAEVSPIRSTLTRLWSSISSLGSDQDPLAHLAELRNNSKVASPSSMKKEDWNSRGGALSAGVLLNATGASVSQLPVNQLWSALPRELHQVIFILVARDGIQHLVSASAVCKCVF